MEYLSPDRVRGRFGQCMAELERVPAAKALAGKVICMWEVAEIGGQSEA
jgi:hypothetical protein